MQHTITFGQISWLRFLQHSFNMISILLIAATLSASSFPLALAQSPAPSSVDVKVGDEVVFQFLGDDKLIPKFKTHAPCDIETGSVFSGYISSACGSPVSLKCSYLWFCISNLSIIARERYHYACR